MSEPWSIDNQSSENQIAYWRRATELLEAQLKAERKRKAPETLNDVEDRLTQALRRLEWTEADRQVWKDIAKQALNRVAELEQDGAAAVLKRERDHWKQSWRNCTRRLGNAIEHLGLDYTGAEPSADED